MSKSSGRVYHVAPRGGQWSVRRAGSLRAASLHGTQQEAIAVARDKVQRAGGELFIHGRDGRIRERSTFGRDPYPPKG